MREQLACVICIASDTCSDKKPVRYDCYKSLAAADRVIAAGYKSKEEVAQAVSEARKAVLVECGNYIDKEVLNTDNRVTKLWVLGPLVRNLQAGIEPWREK